MKFGGNKYLATLATLLVSLIPLTTCLEASTLTDALATPPLSSDNLNPFQFPPCLSKVNTCMADYLKNTDFTAMVNSTEPADPICCPEWAEVIKSDPKCYCDAMADALAASKTLNSSASTNTSQTDDGLKRCNIDGTVASICGEGISTEGAAANSARTNWAGPMFGSILLLAGLLFLY